MKASRRFFRVDRYVVDVLMRDLVGHDLAPSAFVVYLFLLTHEDSSHSAPRVTGSLRAIAEETGLSKSAVDHALRILRRRQLIKSKAMHATTVPTHTVLMPWRRSRK